MKNIAKQLAAVAFTLCVAVPSSFAGRDGSFAKIQAAVQSGSQGAIIAEVERAEHLMCDQCVSMLTSLTNDPRYPVREVAAWWFAKRPALNELMTTQMLEDLATGESTNVRNAADYLGAVVSFSSLPALQQAYNNPALSLDAKLSIINAVARMAHVSGNPILISATQDQYADVRAAAVDAWRNVRNQVAPSALTGLLADPDAHVRAETAALMGGFAMQTATSTLEQLVVKDPDSVVRRNAAWALGKIGSQSSVKALTAATSDSSGLVRGVAATSLKTLGLRAQAR
jgi:HEAT repeat protein